MWFGGVDILRSGLVTGRAGRRLGWAWVIAGRGLGVGWAGVCGWRDPRTRPMASGPRLALSTDCSSIFLQLVSNAMG